MKAIQIHGMAPDNIGDFRQAGTELKVSDKAEAGCISEKRAAALVKANAASVVADKGLAADKAGAK